ncbi:hypothetical protein EVAR_48816_1 [Eumeta japonica]|uniref:Uncharacterized protein n=1 Tax=Eumeta variegata TaxID=151549 RepID=A0A4C1Y0Q6_EUMVA|nr:hypothetical protein EVAR_48816_1 [Eumeta japonica]
MKHLYARWTGVKLRRLKIQETLGFGVRRLRLALAQLEEQTSMLPERSPLPMVIRKTKDVTSALLDFRKE